MTTAVAEQTNKAVARSPHILVPLIQKAIADGKRAYQETADLLAEAHAGFTTYTDFLSWTHRHFNFGETQSRRYLSVGKHRQSYRPIGTQPKSLDGALRAIGKNRPSDGRVHREWQPDVDAIAERARREQERVARLHEEELTRKQEREAQRDLALRIVDIGYKVLAKELHPDKGGSREMMARLNRARDHLKQMA